MSQQSNAQLISDMILIGNERASYEIGGAVEGSANFISQ